uniref:protein FAM136A-like n=1 Tax=Erigeron canadensis TaxID=72917 RepID=UPI001CB8C1DD|nr:protein FAM136A-like [Erigeron canadensis]
MNHIDAAEERIVSERLRQKLNEVNAAAQAQLSVVQDHVNFTLQKAYFKCAYECFDRRRKQDDISACVENCSVPVLQAQNLVEGEMAKFQERLNRSLMVCRDKFESAKLQNIKTNAAQDMESCVNQAIDENVRALPHLVEKLKASLAISPTEE